MTRRELLIFLALSTTACGGGDSSANGSEDQDSEVQDSNQAMEDVELTDELMEDYVAILKELKDAGDSNPMAFLGKHGWSFERWVTISSKVSVGLASAGRAMYGDAAAETVKQLDDQLKDIEARMKQAPAEERQMLEQQLAALRETRNALNAAPEQVTEKDRRSMEVLKRWMPRIDAISSDK